MSKLQKRKLLTFKLSFHGNCFILSSFRSITDFHSPKKICRDNDLVMDFASEFMTKKEDKISKRLRLVKNIVLAVVVLQKVRKSRAFWKSNNVCAVVRHVSLVCETAAPCLSENSGKWKRNLKDSIFLKISRYFLANLLLINVFLILVQVINLLHRNRLIKILVAKWTGRYLIIKIFSIFITYRSKVTENDIGN